MSATPATSELPDRTPVRWGRLAFGVLCLHLLTSARAYPWIATPWTDAAWKLSPDLWFLLAGVSLLCLRFGYRWMFGHVLVLGVLWVPAMRAALEINAYMYGTPFVLGNDAGQLTGLWNGLFASEAAGARNWIGWTLLGCAGAVWSVLYLLCRSVGRQLSEARASAWILSISVVVLAVSFLEKSHDAARKSRFFSESVLSVTLRQVRDLSFTKQLEPRVRQVQERLAETPQDLTRLGGADVLLYVVESYGRNLLRNDPHGARVRRALEDATRRLSDAGLHAASGWLDAPVSGAQSQVSHSSLLSGIPLWSYAEDTRALAVPARMLTHILADRGYRTVNINPKLEIEWPDSARHFGFQVDLFGRHSNYRAEGGHIYHWAPAPDQYFLALARERFLRPQHDPAFLFFIGGVSHAPFSHLPPYIEDWDRALDPKVYQPRKMHAFEFLDYHRQPGIESAYVETILYTIETLTGFLRAAHRPCLLLVVGDHQAPLTGAIAPDPEDYTVPFHAMSNRLELLAPMREFGMRDGLLPGAGDARPMHGFLVAFLKAYANER